MSRATNQSRVLLSIVTGCLYAMSRGKHLSRVDHKEMLANSFKQACFVLDEWPETGKTRKNDAWCTPRIEAWKKVVMEDTTGKYKPVMLVSMCELILNDLTEIIRDKRKLELIGILEPTVQVIHNFVDAEGVNWPAFESSRAIVEEAYKLIEW